MAKAFSTICACCLVLSMAHAANMSEGMKEGLLPGLQVAANIGGPRQSITKQPQQQTIESGRSEPARMPVILEPNTQPAERVSPALPSGPTRQIVVRKIKVDDSLLKRLVARPVAFSRRISAGDRKNLKTIALQIKGGNHAVARDQWGRLVTSYTGKRGARGTDIEAMMQWVLRESYLEQLEALKDYAEKVQYYNDMKKVIRDHLAEMGERAARMDPRNPTKTAKVNTIVRFPPPDRPGAKAEFQWTKKVMSRDEVQAYIDDLEGRLATIEELTQMAQLQLQDELNKQQQLMQLMSNIMKMMHDTAKSIISNMR